MKFRILFLVILSLLCLTCSNDDTNSLPIDIESFSVTTSIGTISEDGGMVTFNFQLPTARQTDIYTYDLTGTAVISEDYELTSTMLSFSVPEGANTASVSVSILDDVDVEDEEETILLTLRERNGTVIGTPPTATVIIEDNDDFPYENGFLIANRGEIAGGIGTVSFVNADFSEVSNNIYQLVNPGSDLGNSIHSIGFTDEFAYIISRGSNRITVVNRFTFEEVAIIEGGLNNPRHFKAIGDKAYVSNQGVDSNLTDDYIAVIDLTQNTVIDTISVAHSPEKLEINETILYVTHQGTVLQPNNIVSIIDSTTDTIIDTLEVGEIPSSIQLDGQGNLWVLSRGRSIVPMGEPSSARISVINLDSNLITNNFEFEILQTPRLLNIDGDSVYYYLNGSVFRGDLVNFNILNTTPIINNLNFTNMNVIGNSIIGLEVTTDFLRTYNVNTFEMINSLEVGEAPVEVYMN